MKARKRGFSVVEVLIALAIVGVLGTIGWLFYARQNTKNTEQLKTVQTEPTKKVPETTDLSEYKSDELGVSLSYPTAWGEPILADGPLSRYQSGDYKQLGFSKATNVSINFVTGPYSSPLDGCGYDDPVLDAQHAQNANQASLIGWDANNIHRYVSGQGFDGPTVFKQSKIAGDTGPGYIQVSTSDKVLVYKDIYYQVKAGSGGGCGHISQAQADAANAYKNFYHYAVNFSNNKVFGVNGQFDGRKGDDAAVRNQLTHALNSVK